MAQLTSEPLQRELARVSVAAHSKGGLMGTSSEHDRFLDQLRTAFPSTPIAGAGAFGPRGTTYPDADPYAAHLEGRCWDQLDPIYMLRRSDALGFLAPAHLAAVLPVYLRSIVEEGVWSVAAGMLTLILAKPVTSRDGLGFEKFQAFVDALSAAQRATVAAALQALAAQDPDGSVGQAALAALESHWKSYLLTA